MTLVSRLAARVGGPGWCGLRDDGRPLFEAMLPVTFRLDGRATPLTGDGALPDKWIRARQLGAFTRNDELLGSPIEVAAIRRTEGVVELTEDGIAGWAWHPGAPDTDPVLTLVAAGRKRQIGATDLSVSFRGTSPLARPRGFAKRLDTSRPVRVLGRDGRDLLGSPLGGSAAPASGAPRRPRQAGTAVIVPVYRGMADTLACIAACWTRSRPDDLVIVVNDASPEPALAASLRALAARKQITLLSADPRRRRAMSDFRPPPMPGLRAARRRATWCC